MIDKQGIFVKIIYNSIRLQYLINNAQICDSLLFRNRLEKPTSSVGACGPARGARVAPRPVGASSVWGAGRRGGRADFVQVMRETGGSNLVGGHFGGSTVPTFTSGGGAGVFPGGCHLREI